jgi:hypothetical protein
MILMYFACFNSQDDCMYTRINCFMFGFLILILGIQGLCNILNDTIQSNENIKSYSAGFVVGGLSLVTISLLKCGEKDKEVSYINL